MCVCVFCQRRFCCWKSARDSRGARKKSDDGYKKVARKKVLEMYVFFFAVVVFRVLFFRWCVFDAVACIATASGTRCFYDITPPDCLTTLYTVLLTQLDWVGTSPLAAPYENSDRKTTVPGGRRSNTTDGLTPFGAAVVGQGCRFLVARSSSIWRTVWRVRAGRGWVGTFYDLRDLAARPLIMHPQGGAEEFFPQEEQAADGQLLHYFSAKKGLQFSLLCKGGFKKMMPLFFVCL